MASKNRPGHGDRKAAAKTLKQKRVEKRSKRTSRRIEHERPVERAIGHSG